MAARKNENLAKWTAALRSGEFKQGKDRLRRRDDSYCCLGVACEVYRRETGKGEWYVDGFVVDGDGSDFVLPAPVADWLGVPPDGARANRRKALASLNDVSGYSFKRIADVIEKEWGN